LDFGVTVKILGCVVFLGIFERAFVWILRARVCEAEEVW
jgi:hypothetical protein